MASAAAATAAASSGAVSLPLLALLEAKTRTVIVETRDGRSYRGILLSLDVNTGNISLGKNICVDKGGYKTAMNETLIRGTEVALVQLPSIIKNADFLKADFIRSVKERRRLRESATGGDGEHPSGESKLAQRLATRRNQNNSAVGASNNGKPSRHRVADGSGEDPSSHGQEGRVSKLSHAGELARRMKEARKGKNTHNVKRSRE